MSEKSDKGSANLSMPYYPLFHRDFHFDTMLWPLDAVGAMIRLMNWQWERGYLPANQKQLAQICQCQDAEQWSRLWIDYLSAKFPEAEPGKLLNDRLHREYVRICDRNAQAKAAAEKRWSGRISDRICHTETETETETDTKTDNKNTKGPVPYQKIVDLYHEHCPHLPAVKVLSDKRKKTIRARWHSFEFYRGGPGKKELHKFDDLETWERYFKFITDRCPFMNGENERGWVANFDFVIRESGMINIMENKYVSKQK